MNKSSRTDRLSSSTRLLDIFTPTTINNYIIAVCLRLTYITDVRREINRDKSSCVKISAHY